MSELKILYSKKFPKLSGEIDDIYNSAHFQINYKNGREFINNLVIDSEYARVPACIENKDNFINKVIQLSSDYEFSAEIVEISDRIAAKICFENCFLPHEIKKLFAEIFYMADDVTFLTNKNDPEMITISFSYYIRDHYLPVKKDISFE